MSDDTKVPPLVPAIMGHALFVTGNVVVFQLGCHCPNCADAIYDHLKATLENTFQLHFDFRDRDELGLPIDPTPEDIDMRKARAIGFNPPGFDPLRDGDPEGPMSQEQMDLFNAEPMGRG